jgi:rubrerythrin
MGTNPDRVRARRAFSEDNEAVQQVGIRVDESANKTDSVIETPLDDHGFVDFAVAGNHATGEFRCADCGYGAVVHSALPPCPMCGGTIWESRGPLQGRPID